MRAKLLQDIEAFKASGAEYIPSEAMAAAFSLPPKKISPGKDWDNLEEDKANTSQSQPSSKEAQSKDEQTDAEAAKEIQNHRARVAAAQPKGAVQQLSGDKRAASGKAKTAGPDARPHSDKPILPERMTIPLPSNLGRGFCSKYGLQTLIETELHLREGQMNDALQGVRLAVGYKSFLYRNSVRKATTHRKKLRSFDEVHQADGIVRGHSRLYSSARKAVVQLTEEGGADDRLCRTGQKLLEKYEVLKKADIQANTALIEQGVRGVSKLHLSWIWGLNVEGDSKGAIWVEDSGSLCLMILTRPAESVASVQGCVAARARSSKPVGRGDQDSPRGDAENTYLL